MTAATETARRLVAAYRDDEEALLSELAGQLHDTLGQDLTVLLLMLESQGVAAWSERERDRPRQLINGIGSRMRQLMYALCPPPLDSGGLEFAIRELARASDTAVDWALPPDTAGLDKEMRLLTYRAVQRLLNLARRFSARDAQLALRPWPAAVSITLRANGASPTANALRGLEALVLVGLGCVVSESASGDGYSLTLELKGCGGER